MQEDVDRLTAALRDIAVEDAGRAPSRIDLQIAGELRARRVAPPPAGHWFGIAVAATLALAVTAGVWFAARPPLGDPAAGAGAVNAGRAEVVTAFMPLRYSALPYTDAQIVRLEVSRSALRNFGLAPADLPADAPSAASQNTVLADVVVGEDGLARAVRFVRAERNTGVAP